MMESLIARLWAIVDQFYIGVPSMSRSSLARGFETICQYQYPLMVVLLAGAWIDVTNDVTITH